MGLELSKKGWDLLKRCRWKVVDGTHKKHGPGSVIYEDDGRCEKHCPTQSFIADSLKTMVLVS